jgi:hypothetical protein|tara:strand:+ start:74 stop:1531 length:1458 start_codon:yes stop_codon:yes gene_type:complete
MKIYDNQIKAAKKVKEEFEDFYSPGSHVRTKFINLKGKLQAGKTGCLVQIAEELEGHNIIALTTYDDKTLVGQFEDDFFNSTNVRTIKISTLLKKLKTDSKLVKRCENADAFFIDESEYRVGPDSELSKFIEFMFKNFPKKRFFFVFAGATNYTLIHLGPQFKFPVKRINLKTGEEYIGIQNFINSPNFNHIERKGPVKITDELLDSLKDTISQNTTGLSMIRIPSKMDRADEVATDLEKVFSSEIESDTLEIRSIHSKTNGGIKSSLREAMKESMMKNVIIIVVGGLSAGVRFPDSIKSNIRFVYETYSKKASAIQGLIGRCCGYHDNIPVMWADKSVLEEYLNAHNNSENYTPGENASTHLNSKISEDIFVSGELVSEHKTIDRDELENILGISFPRDYRYSQSGSSTNFKNQWKESFSKQPNYYRITWTSRNQEMKPYHILINTDEGVSKVFKKTGDIETRTSTETTSTSFLNDDKYINKEK